MNRLRITEVLCGRFCLIAGWRQFSFGDPAWLLAVFIAWIAAAAYCLGSGANERKHGMADGPLFMQSEHIDKTLNHHRHDWMNDLQVLMAIFE